MCFFIDRLWDDSQDVYMRLLITLYNLCKLYFTFFILATKKSL